MSIMNEETAMQVWVKALMATNPIDITFQEKKTAARFRFLMYNARKKEKKLLAQAKDLPESEVQSDYDEFTISIIENENDCTLRVSRMETLESLNIRDALTGEEV